MMKPIREKHPEITPAAIDYDAGATDVNQENRIRLMHETGESEESLCIKR